MQVKVHFGVCAAHAAVLGLLAVPALAFAQAQPSQTGSSDFSLAAQSDSQGNQSPEASTVSGRKPSSRANSPDRTVGPQQDGSVVVSDNQRLTPAGKIIELGSPVRAKALALNPRSKLNSGAVLLMGAAQPIVVFDTETGQIVQRFTPTLREGAEVTPSVEGSFTGIAYSADGTRLFFSQDRSGKGSKPQGNSRLVIVDVNPKTA
ncbi:MAG: hypothetical protein ACRD2G_02700, partial [Terriglobia bacterium]